MLMRQYRRASIRRTQVAHLTRVMVIVMLMVSTHGRIVAIRWIDIPYVKLLEYGIAVLAP